MITVSVKKGLDLNLSGRPGPAMTLLGKPDYVALAPGRIPYITPKLLVKEGDAVKQGTPLFFDKRDPRVRFLSPGGGRVKAIRFGERRSIREIAIALSPVEEKDPFPAFSESDIDRMPRSDLVSAMLNGGVWPLLRALPFRDRVLPEEIPPAIWVVLENTDPFHPSPDHYLSGREALFLFGLRVLNRLSGTVQVVKGNATRMTIPSSVSDKITHLFSGPYPAHDPGVLVYHTKKHPGENKSAYVTGQDLLLIAELLKSGTFPVSRFMTVSGPLAEKRITVETRIGVPVSHIASIKGKETDFRMIAGGVFCGYPVQMDDCMGVFETALTVMARGDQKEFLGFARPGINKPSHSRTFLSAFRKKPLDMDCGIHGENRACVNCSLCANVCPVDILPQFMMKAIHAGEIEEALNHGLLDCVVCGLCAYVCPSKIELPAIFKQARTDYYKEIQ